MPFRRPGEPTLVAEGQPIAAAFAAAFAAV